MAAGARTDGCCRFNDPVDAVAVELLRISFSFNRLRTTPARKPRTECCCQPVAFIMAAIVAPSGDCSIAITRDCFEPVSAGFLLVLDVAQSLIGRDAVCRSGTGVASSVAAARFFADFVIGILHSVQAACAAPPKPRLGHQAGGAGSREPLKCPELSTVPLCLPRNASPFWIILLLSWRDVEHLVPLNS